MNLLPIVVLGGGGHTRVLIDALLLLDRKVLGYTDIDSGKGKIRGIPYLGDDSMLQEYDRTSLRLVNGVGSIGSPSSRRRLFEQFRGNGFEFESVIHPSSVVSSDVVLGEGVQIMAGAVVQAGTGLGANSIINTGALVDHDCHIAAHVHVAPGAVLSGNTQLEEEVHVGSGAVVIQGLVIGRRSLIGAGAVVIENVPAGVTVVGVPGKVIGLHEAD